MSTLVEERSRITAKGQTTVPRSVRQALGVGTGDEIAFRIDAEGVTVRRAGEPEVDPVLDRFLDFLARDMADRPDRIEAFPDPLARRIADLVGAIDIDPNDAIEGAVDL